MTVADTPKTQRSFVPDANNTRQLRDAFGRFATGVTIVTVATPNGPMAITANSFSSLSLDPPLVLWAPDKGSRRFAHFAQAEHFAIHVLAADQEDLCWRIARDGAGLAEMAPATNAEGVPVLAGCLARFECRHYASYDGGDHEIVVGQVLRAAQRDDGDALTFFRGKMAGHIAQ
ncbi:NADH-FMN oxidoreductase RutF, flavin reductase (DIM6/NTAB) family [Yoonia tamlensis]|uniref:NADH-FMN oxidoreductase RutF, flavin reductase (DIM6/NTAB) family n=1 Tax=Yoonia tamlensis TaxID=390270 RepID=A0A1I6HGF0_9RHOB|nr:flavin reductase family protein [Yoonia tamlensis]SFR53390.1 NADH-FMN oxidoreductase RutF, flavin reductase (DIM6/NTAB) family [Yoonia tamlensis]